MIPLYILGLLIRFGPRHGYQIKKLVEQQLEDFTQIKLPVIYYHLEKMEAAGLLLSRTAQEGLRPEKKVYRVSKKGNAEFQSLLRRELDIKFRPAFDVDAVFFFSDQLAGGEIAAGLDEHLRRLRQALAHIEEHRVSTLPRLPETMRPFADIIFAHHAAHYRAEIDWAEKSIKVLKEKNNHDKTKNN